MSRKSRKSRKSYILNDCARCRYVVGATCGFEPLSETERKILLDDGYELTQNAQGEGIARKGSGHFNSARFELHRVQCHPTWSDVLMMETG